MKNFHALVKPASSLCNMRCKYCFYADVSELRDVKSYGIMRRETARALIDRAVEFTDESGAISIAFQGGEPTLAGIEFFRDFCGYLSKRAAGRRLNFSIQTNGINLNGEWCELFKKYDFLVGLSLDGNEQNNDYYRLFEGRGSFERVMRAAVELRSAKVEFNILSVVTDSMAKRPKKTFDFYRRCGFSHIQFIPCLPPLEKSEGALSVRLYADFLKQTAKIWFEEFVKNKRYVSVRLFDNLVMIFKGKPPEQCGTLGRCSFQFVVEADGSVYPCDFYVLDKYRCGNVATDSVEEIVNSTRAKEFLLEKPGEVPCGGCNVSALCGGGCKRTADFYFSEENYCPYRDFLDECGGLFAKMARMV